MKNRNNCLPCNLDGVTERLGHFLVLELKHGENLSRGQELMLKALAAKPGFTILMVNCQWTTPNAKGGRDFTPETFRVMDANGALGEEYQTNFRAFAYRYDIWCRTPEHGPRPFTCSSEDFEKSYLRWLPEDLRPDALEQIKKERGSAND